jgi:hypothetical protein
MRASSTFSKHTHQQFTGDITMADENDTKTTSSTTTEGGGTTANGGRDPEVPVVTG